MANPIINFQRFGFHGSSFFTIHFYIYITHGGNNMAGAGHQVVLYNVYRIFSHGASRIHRLYVVLQFQDNGRLYEEPGSCL